MFADGMLGMIEASTTRMSLQPMDAQLIVHNRGLVRRRPHPRGADQMIRRRAVLARVIQPLVVRMHVGTRQRVALEIARQRLRVQQPARPVHALDQNALVHRVLEIIRLDDRIDERIGRPRAHMAQALRPVLPHPARHPGIVVQQPDKPLLVAGGAEHALQVRLAHRVLGLPEPVHDRRRHRQDAGFAHHPAGDLPDQAEPVRQLVHRADVLHPGDDAGRVMVAEILPHRQIGDHRNAKVAQQPGRSDARDLQQLRGVGGAGGDDHLLAREHLTLHRTVTVVHVYPDSAEIRRICLPTALEAILVHR